MALSACALFACNPLDPDKIDTGGDGGSTTKQCNPACGGTQYCLITKQGTCQCYQACDSANCATQGQICVTDGIDFACFNPAEVKCK